MTSNLLEVPSAISSIAGLVGHCSPLGATVQANGVNFSVFSRCASAIELLLFDRDDDPLPSRVIRIPAATNRTYHYWHTFVPGLRAGQLYGFRVEGPRDPDHGQGQRQG